MIAVIFEVEIASSQSDAYLETAEHLRSDLEAIDGFISVERFQSLSGSGKLLSLSFFENEESVRQWRTRSAHRDAQHAGRSAIFSDYRLRVAHVVRDYGMFERDEVPH